VNVDLRVQDMLAYKGDALIVNLFEGVTKPGGATAAVDQALGGLISQAIAQGEFQGKAGTHLLLHTQGKLKAERVLVAAGPYSADVGALAGVEIPCRPFRRQVLVVEPLPELPDEFPLTVDGDTEWYVHRQGRSAVLLGGTDKNSHPGTDTEVDWPAFEAVMRAASHRVPILERAPVMRAYAGTRELSPDYSGIIGPVPQAPGLWVACGFSGHGFMHAPAIGIVMAELLLDGVASTLDATPLLYERFLRGNIRVEANIF